MLRLNTKFALVLVATLGLTGCGKSGESGTEAKPATSSSTSSGVILQGDAPTAIAKNTYHNAPFKLTVTAPDGWFVADTEQTQKLMEVGRDIMSAGNDQLRAVTDASLKQSGQIFVIFKHPPGTPVDGNPGVLAIFENVAASPGVQSGRDYFFHAKKIMAQSAASYEFLGDYTDREIGGQTFAQMDLKITVGDVVAPQSYYATRHGDFVVLFIRSYASDAERKETDAILDSVKLDW